MRRDITAETSPRSWGPIRTKVFLGPFALAHPDIFCYVKDSVM